jgi:hypothetical protein
MATRAQSTQPPWAAKYLWFAAWTQNELRNLLCGLSPDPPDDTPLPNDAPVPSRKEAADAFVREELRRVAADRHIRDAISAGDLKVLEPPDEQLLEKVRPHLLLEEFDALSRAIRHERSCSKAYRVAPKAAIWWAASLRAVFPDFPFTVEDLQPADDIRTSKAGIPNELKAHRRRTHSTGPGRARPQANRVPQSAWNRPRHHPRDDQWGPAPLRAGEGSAGVEGIRYRKARLERSPVR